MIDLATVIKDHNYETMQAAHEMTQAAPGSVVSVCNVQAYSLQRMCQRYGITFNQYHGLATGRLVVKNFPEKQEFQVPTTIENIACIPKHAFDECGSFQGFTPNIQRYAELLKAPSFAARDKLENDPRYKQLIPYIIIRKRLGASVPPIFFSYCRAPDQSEARLHNKFSIGVGGHVNDQDAKSLADPFLAGAYRELHEEVTFSYLAPVDEDHAGVPSESSLRPVGLINDDSNEVGAVHLGVVFLCDADELVVQPNEADEASMHHPHWYAADELKHYVEDYETWSQICINDFLNA